MNTRNAKPYLLWILLTEAVGATSALLIRNATELYGTIMQKPPLSPPAIVFPIIWTVLYFLMGIGMARVILRAVPERRCGCALAYGVQLMFHFLWSIWFFKLRAFGFALAWLIGLWGMILWMLLRFYRIDRPAGLMQLPYLLWVTFAGYLNAGVWLLNR